MSVLGTYKVCYCCARVSFTFLSNVFVECFAQEGFWKNPSPKLRYQAPCTPQSRKESCCRPNYAQNCSLCVCVQANSKTDITRQTLRVVFDRGVGRHGAQENEHESKIAHATTLAENRVAQECSLSSASYPGYPFEPPSPPRLWCCVYSSTSVCRL